MALTVESVLGKLARHELPWDEAWVAEFPEFDERFTLHDSNWIGAFLAMRESDDAIAMFEWDAHWLPEPLRMECGVGIAESPYRNPFLLIYASGVQAVQLRDFPCDFCSQIGVARSWFEDGIKVLELMDVIGGTMRLEFTGQIEYLALHAEDGHVLDLATIPPRAEPPPTQKRPWWKFLG